MAKRNEFVKKFVEYALKWEDSYGVAPRITGSLGEYDAAMRVGFSEKKYNDYMKNVTAAQKGFDFENEGKKYQVKACRSSSKKGGKVINAIIGDLSVLAENEWDYLIWIEYDREYEIQKMRCVDKENFKANHGNGNKKYLSIEATAKWEHLVPEKIGGIS